MSGVTATAIVIADMVGIGVFTSLGFQVGDITSGFALLLLWIVGGAVALCGALCYAELATMLPRSSGEYNFLRRIYHPAFGFVAGWLSATVGFAAPIALAAMAFGVYFKAIAPSAPPLLMGLGLTWALALVHLCGVQFAGAFHNAWTIFKLALIVIFIAAGFAFGDAQPISFAPQSGALTAVMSAPFAISLVFVMYSYSGWNAATYIAGEVQNPARNLPRALLIGTAVVIVLYVGLNAVMLATTPLCGTRRPARRRHGGGPAHFRPARRAFRRRADQPRPGVFHQRHDVDRAAGDHDHGRGHAGAAPVRAASRRPACRRPQSPFSSWSRTSCCLTQSFEAVLDFIQFSLTFCSFFTVLGVIKMRITHPELVRPYRAWGYPITPLVFLSLTLFMMYYLVVNRPLQSLGGLGLMAAGLVIYYASRLISNVPPSDSAKTIPLKADALDRA